MDTPKKMIRNYNNISNKLSLLNSNECLCSLKVTVLNIFIKSNPIFDILKSWMTFFYISFLHLLTISYHFSIQQFSPPLLHWIQKEGFTGEQCMHVIQLTGGGWVKACEYTFKQRFHSLLKFFFLRYTNAPFNLLHLPWLLRSCQLHGRKRRSTTCSFDDGAKNKGSFHIWIYFFFFFDQIVNKCLLCLWKRTFAFCPPWAQWSELHMGESAVGWLTLASLIFHV